MSEGERAGMQTTWSDVRHQQECITVVLPVAESLALKAALVDLVRHNAEAEARSAAQRGARRKTGAMVSSFLDRLTEGLRPYDMPSPTVEDVRPL